MNILSGLLNEINERREFLEEEERKILALIEEAERSLPDKEKLAVYIYDKLNKSKTFVPAGFSVISQYSWLVSILDNNSHRAVQELKDDVVWNQHEFKNVYKLSCKLLNEFSFEESIKIVDIVLEVASEIKVEI